MHIFNDILGILLVITNLPLLAVIIKFFKKGDLINAFIFFMTMIISISYHICKDMGFCMWNYRILETLDILLASSIPILISVNISQTTHDIFCHDHNKTFKTNLYDRNTCKIYNRQMGHLFFFIGFLCNICFLLNTNSVATFKQKFFITIYGISIIIYGLLSRIRCDNYKKFNGLKMIKGLIIAIIGYILFEEPFTFFLCSHVCVIKYQIHNISHVFWHLLSAIGTYMIISS